jgi:hypothetical protein
MVAPQRTATQPNTPDDAPTTEGGEAPAAPEPTDPAPSVAASPADEPAPVDARSDHELSDAASRPDDDSPSGAEASGGGAEPAVPRASRRDAEAAETGSGRASAGALRREDDERTRFPHRGATLEIGLGPMGCVRGLCGDDRHAVAPGVRLDGFVGGNILGFVELGLAGGWGSMRSRATEGTNALSMYGLDPWLLQQALYAQSAGLLNIDLAGLSITGARMQTAQVGPLLRVHFIPRGRVAVWAGSGAQYHLLRNRYDTLIGQAKMSFHGIAVPIEAGLGVFVHRNVALTARFDYLWTWYGLAVLDHPDQSVTLPVSVLDAAAGQQGIELRQQLPQFWTGSRGVRGRL